MRMLRRREVARLTGYSCSHIDWLEKHRKFPRRVRIGENAIAWVDAEIREWLAEKVAARDAELAEEAAAEPAEAEPVKAEQVEAEPA